MENFKIAVIAKQQMEHLQEVAALIDRRASNQRQCDFQEFQSRALAAICN